MVDPHGRRVRGAPLPLIRMVNILLWLVSREEVKPPRIVVI